MTCAEFARRYNGNGMPLAWKGSQPEQPDLKPNRSQLQRREIMVSMAIPSQLCMRESIERKPRTSAARNDVLGFVAQSIGLVCVAIFLYSLGPALGMTLIAVSLAVWSLLRSQIACEEEDTEQAAALQHSPSDYANPVWMKNRFAMSTAAATRPAQRQGA
jgi:hypothetical protein